MANIGMERNSEHRECWGVSKRLVDENHRRKRVANLTSLSLERAGGIYMKMREQGYKSYIGKQGEQMLPSDGVSKLAKARGGRDNLSEIDKCKRVAMNGTWGV